MLIKLTSLFCLFVFSVPFILSSRGYAGAGSSGGAKVVVCKSSEEHRGDVELLDLYEARRNGGQIRTALGAIEVEFAEYLRVLANALNLSENLPSIDVAAIKKEISEKIRFVDLASQLPVLDDIGTSPKLPDGCTLRQLAVYKDASSLLWIDKKLWEQISAQTQAAVLAHEQIYRDLRQQGDITSENTRKIVGSLFSKFEPIEQEIDFSNISFPYRFAQTTASSAINPPCVGTEVAQFKSGNLVWLKIQGECRSYNLLAYNSHAVVNSNPVNSAILTELCESGQANRPYFKTRKLALTAVHSMHRSQFISQAFFDHDFGYGKCHSPAKTQKIAIQFLDGSWENNGGKDYTFSSERFFDLSGLPDNVREKKIFDLLSEVTN